MRWVVLTIGLFLLVAGFNRLAAQSFVLDPNLMLPEKKTTMPTEGISIGTSPRKIETADKADEDDESSSGLFPANRPRPAQTPGFGFGGVYRPRMTFEEIQRRKAEDAMRKQWETAQQEAILTFERRVKEAVDKVLWSRHTDVFGEVDEIPRNLRRVNPVNAEERPKANDLVKPPAVTPPPPVVPPRTPPIAVASNSSPSDTTTTPQTEDERTDADIERREKEIEMIEDDEQRQRETEFLQRRKEALANARKRRAEDEQGAVFFDLPPNLRIPEQQLRAGWCRLFDGKTLFGWRAQKEGPYGGGHFFVDDEMICSDPKRPGLLYTTNQFGDATFQLEYQAEENAEVFLLVRTSPNPQDLHSSCYAVVLNSADFQRPRGTILGRQTLSVDQIRKQEREARDAMDADSLPPELRWRKVTAQFDGAMLRVTIDKDEAVTLFEAKPPGCGYLGILVTKGTAKFRNMTWFPGSSISLFNGVDPTPDWRHQDGTVRWIPTKDITMHLTGGPGVVETRKNFENFVLQFEYNMTYNAGRSGLFVRARPREEQTGYEISIQNLPTKEERAATLGVDVGSLRGIKKGRYVRPSDQRWNYVTVLVVDRHFQTWVNGVTVFEWTVPPDQQLITSGTFQFLAPTDRTDIQFRNIKVTPILPRGEKPRTFEDRAQTTYIEINEQRKAAEREKRLDEEMKRRGRD